jgi:hypothetical protein
MAGEISRAVRPEPARGDTRDTGREFLRIKPREPHEKYAIPEDRRQPGMDYFMAAVKIRGQPNPRFSDYWRAGWRPVKASALPELSGLDLNPDQSLIDLGVVRAVGPDDPIIIDDLMPMMRPMQMSRAAKAEQQAAAEQQVSDHLRAQRDKSVRAVGVKNTRIDRHYAPADEAPSDSEVEMG